MSSLPPAEMRKAMEECIRSLRAELCPDAPQAADIRLAEIIEQFILDKVMEHTQKVCNQVDQMVMDCINQKIAAGEFKAQLTTAVATAVPDIVMRSAQAALTKVPFSKIIGVPDNNFGDLQHLSAMTVREVLGDVASQTLRTKTATREMGLAMARSQDTFQQKHNALLVKHNALAEDFAKILSMLEPVVPMVEKLEEEAPNGGEFIVTADGIVYKKELVNEESIEEAIVEAVEEAKSHPDFGGLKKGFLV